MSSAFEPPQSRKAPCPCGSGKKYKHCHGAHSKSRTSPNRQWLGWVVGVAVVMSVGGIILWQRDESQLPASVERLGFPLLGGDGNGGFNGSGYASIDAVDMSSLSEAQRVNVMRTANTQRCTCGCNMTLARCINTDTTCPLRGKNLKWAKQLVSEIRL